MLEEGLNTVWLLPYNTKIKPEMWYIENEEKFVIQYGF